MADDSSDFLKRNRRRARNRYLLMVVLLASAVGGVAWRAVGLFQRMSQREGDEVRLVVGPDSTASWEGQTYGKDDYDRLLADVAARHPKAHVLVCAPDARSPLGAMVTVKAQLYGLEAGLVRLTDARCK
ncbi:MAG: hypothetical protein QM765_32570 [Myxococcales bacterium]